MLHCGIFFFILCLFFCPKEWMQNFTQNNSLCPVNQNHIGCHFYPNENIKSEVCVKKADKSPIESGFLIAYAQPYGKKKRSRKNRGGNSQIYSNPTPIDTGDFYIPDNNNIIRIRYYVYRDGRVEYSAYIDSGKDSFFKYLFNGFNVIRCMFYGRFYIDDPNEKLNFEKFLEKSNYKNRLDNWKLLPFYEL